MIRDSSAEHNNQTRSKVREREKKTMVKIGNQFQFAQGHEHTVNIIGGANRILKCVRARIEKEIEDVRTSKNSFGIF